MSARHRIVCVCDDDVLVNRIARLAKYCIAACTLGMELLLARMRNRCGEMLRRPLEESGFG